MKKDNCNQQVESSLSSKIMSSCRVYEQQVKQDGRQISKYRKKDIEKIKKMCVLFTSEQVLYNKLNFFIKEEMSTKRIGWTLFIFSVSHSELKLFLRSALEEWDKQSAKSSLENSLLLQRQEYLAEIAKLKKSFGDEITGLRDIIIEKDKQIASLQQENQSLREQSLIKENAKLHKIIFDLQKAKLDKCVSKSSKAIEVSQQSICSDDCLLVCS